jgi:hypothetical protein
MVQVGCNVEDEADERLPLKLGPSSMTSTSGEGTKGRKNICTDSVARFELKKASRISTHNILVNSSSTSFKLESMAYN